MQAKSEQSSESDLDKHTRAQILAYCWKEGDLDYLLKDHQMRIEEAFMASSERVFVLEIGRQVGKTYWACKKALEVCMIIPNARVKYASAFLTSVEEYVIPTLKKLVEDCPEQIRPKWLESKKKYVFKNGSELKLLGLDRDPNAGRGPYCDLYIIDEAGFVRTLEATIDSVILPMFNTRPHGRLILSSSSPETPAHPFVGLADKYRLLGSYIKMTIRDNKDLSKDRIKAIESEYQDKNAMLRELYCERIVDASLAIIPEFRDEFIQDVPEDDLRQFYHNYVSMDLGVLRDFTAGVTGYYEYTKARFVQTHEFDIKGPEMTTELLKGLINDIEAQAFQKKQVYKRISDNNNPLLINDLNVIHGIPFIPTNKTELRAMVNQARMWVNQGRYVIHPRCVKSIGCMRSGVWTNNRKEFDRSIAFGHFDWLAAIIYLVRNIDEQINPIPFTYGHNLEHHNVLIIPRQVKPLLRSFPQE